MPLPDGAGGDIDVKLAHSVLRDWARGGLKNVRFSGGEPTLYKRLADLSFEAKQLGVERVAISTNGSNKPDVYERLIDAGVDDVSVSLDACCSITGDKMSNTSGKFDRVVESIRFIADSGTYITVGIVLNQDNINEVNDTIMLAHGLGVSDIRVISVAQEDMSLLGHIDVPHEVLEAHPILKYRVENIKSGNGVRGLSANDSPKCYLVQDDSVVAGKYHWPCVIYMRELGQPIGDVGPNMREDRVRFFETFNPHDDPICKRTCLDVCVDFNNKCHHYRSGETTARA
jgi:molybdenum cofactor biosynthesis enzyme MoaA